MNEIVLDSSALLTLLNQEKGIDRLTPDVLAYSVCSTVNIAEVQTKLVQRGFAADEAWEAITGAIRQVIDFTPEQARLTGTLVEHTRSLGLSLGDRACLAVGILLDAPIYTADRSWKNLKITAKIHVIR
jgi:ribonuclease VapC